MRKSSERSPELSDAKPVLALRVPRYGPQKISSNKVPRDDCDGDDPDPIGFNIIEK